MRNIKIIVLCILVMASMSFISLYAAEQFRKYPEVELNSTRSIKLNGKAENKSPVDILWTEADLLEDGFIQVAESNELSLYLKRNILNIAVLDHRTGYIWFGYYPKYNEKNYTGSVRQLIESGITVDYADAISLNEARMSLSSPDAGTEIDYTYLDDGFKAEINMVKLGISFELNVQLINDELIVDIPYQSIVEVPYQTAAMRFPREFKLLSIMVFPYLGAHNFEINAYAFVPDGSGALIRYEDTPYNSAYIRRVHGRDLGIQTPITTQSHLKEEPPLSLPIFGINHGYEQAAFLAEVKSGFGATELHAYPYQFNNLDINRTFFMYKTRDKSLIRLSGGDTQTISIINKDPYPEDYEVVYAFLSGEDASYAGMAKRYQSHLDLNQKLEETNIDMHLEVIGLDMKPSLIGQSIVKLTTYQDVIDMSRILLEDVSNLHITYRSYNKNGFFGSSSNQMRAARQLGGNRGLNKLTDYIRNEENVTLSLYHDPLVTPNPGTFQTTLRKTTLDMFYTSIKSSRIDEAYLMTVTGISERILRNQKNFEKHQITALSLESVGQLNFSYQLGQNTIYREEMIEELISEIEALDSYDLGLYQPHSYLFNQIDRYYDMMYQSNLYSFMTDSVPFISLVLSGHVKLYTSHLNYVNDLDIMALKMIEYNLRPAFITTKAQGYMLRHTNYEYLFTTEFDLWKSSMIEQYQKVSPYLNQVINAKMIDHQFITDDVVKVFYDNDITIYINYGNQSFSQGSINVLPMSAYVHEVTT